MYRDNQRGPRGRETQKAGIARLHMLPWRLYGKGVQILQTAGHKRRDLPVRVRVVKLWVHLPDGQEEVNQLVDYAISHGVNYFDTAPTYKGGNSEVLTGNALSRHPREKYLVATKMSNQRENLWSMDASRKMYEQSFQRLKVDYIDYYLLHSVGNGGLDTLRARFLDNGLLDFLLKEREAGRIRHLGFSYHGDVSGFDFLLDHQDEYLN